MTILSLLVLQNLFVVRFAAAQSNDLSRQPAISTTVVISEFRSRGAAGASDEFIELFNVTANPINIGGWKINYSSSGGTTSTRVTVAANTTIPAYGHFLVTNATATTGYSGTVPGNQTYTTGVADDGGIAVLNASDLIIDQVGMSAGSAYKEGNFLTPLTTSVNRCYERKPGGAAGNSLDTDNNAADFSIVSPCNPQNLASAATPPNGLSGTGAANPSSVVAGSQTLLTVAVTPAINPPSTNIAVVANLSSIGGSATQNFFDNGTNGDQTAGDNIFSYTATVAATTAAGGKTLPVTITDAESRTGTAGINLTVTSNSTAPTAIGSANPNSVLAGATTLLTVTVTPGTNPASTGIAVGGNLTAIGGSNAQPFYDDGTNGDVTPGDNVFSYQATVAAGTAAGGKSLPVTVTDAQTRTANATITLTVTAPPASVPTLPFAQDWSNTNLITTDNDWSGVPGIVGYRGDDLTTAIGADPQTITSDGATTPVNVVANQADPNAVTSGGIYEFENGNPTVAFQGSGTADAPHLVISLNTTGSNNVTVYYTLRDIESSADNAIQPVALQYRVGNSGNYTNVPAAFVADATTGPNEATRVTPVAVVLPPAADNQPLIQLRIITTNALNNDELVGIDDISVVSNGTIPLRASGSASPAQTLAGSTTLLTVSVSPATNPVSTGIAVTGDLTTIGGAATQTFYDDGTNGDSAAGDNVFSYLATVASGSFSGPRSLPITISDAQMRTATTVISVTVVTPADPAEHLVMGNPTNAVTDVNQPFNYLLPKSQYAMSYHRDRAIPNWVSWHLDASWIGAADRQDDFRPDESLPAGWYRVTQFDYSGSGFDRGHHTPSADRTRSIPDNSATFLMTNMMPQAPDNNQGPWESLEGFGRTLVGQGNELYILAAGTGTGGTGSNGGVTQTIAGGKIAVPSYTWKVILVLPNGDNDVSRVTTATRTIAVIMPNTQGIRTDPWQKYLATVDQVEALTGYDFFSNVPTAVQDVIESRLDAASNTAPQSVSSAPGGSLNVTAPNTTLTNNVTITGDLRLGGSLLTTAPGVCLTLAPGATVTRISGYVSGCVTRQFNQIAPPLRSDENRLTADESRAPAVVFEYPVGTANGYSPVVANVTSAAAGSALSVTAVQGNQPNAPSPAFALKRYWTLTETGDVTADLTFKYLDKDLPAFVPEANFRLQRYEAGAFTEIPATIDTAANTATANGISQFSDWTLLAPIAPTAAAVSVSGRVSLPDEFGLTSALVTLVDQSGNAQTARTGRFGSYRFVNLRAGDTYFIRVSARGLFFAPQTITASEDVTEVNFAPLD